MTADRRINAASRIRQLGKKRVIKRLAHAMKTLEFESRNAAGVLDHAGDGECVVSGELRKKPVARGQELFYAGHVAEIGHGLAREHRVIGKSALLRALDLGVPIGALDQSNREPAAQCDGRVLDPGDHRQGALLIGLHGEPKTFPAAQ